MIFLAATDSLTSLLVFLGFVVISALANWLKRKKAGDETGSPAPPPVLPRGTQRPAAPSASWEEEIRRLLEGETAAPPEPPPLIIRTPRPAPPVAPKLPPVEAKVPIAEVEEFQEKLTTRLAHLDQSAAAFHQASQLSKNISDRLKHIDPLAGLPKPDLPLDRRKRPRPEMAQALQLLRRPGSARQAVIVSAILGPPKALEN